MVKMRDANYCNLKLLLIFLVVYGHWIEASIYESQLLLIQYKIIYMFHMPVFIFLSGFFLNSAKDCLRQIKRLLPMYVLCQSLALICGVVSEADTPWWTLWYLLSYCFWTVLGILWFRIKRNGLKCVILVIAIAMGAIAGYIPNLDRTWSGSRTVVFFPYFLAGLICTPDVQWKKYRVFGVIAFVAAICGILLWADKIPVSFLYHATSFGTIKNGFALRILCYGIGGLLGLFLLTNISGKRFPFTKAGADTMPVYLIHSPLMLCLRELNLPWIVCAGLSVGLIYFVNKILQWNSTPFGVIPVQRRDRGVWISRNIRRTQQGGISLSSVLNKE